MTMSLREMNLRVFQREPIPHVFFQPRFEPWFDWHTQFGSLPLHLQGLSVRDAYDLIGASMRTVHYYTGQPDPIVVRYADEVAIDQRQEGDLLKERIDTPHGPLFETQKLDDRPDLANGGVPGQEARGSPRPALAAGAPPSTSAPRTSNRAPPTLGSAACRSSGCPRAPTSPWPSS